MRLIKLKLTNFRSYLNETTIELGDLVVIVGKNDSGKSSLLDALRIFFDDTSPDKDDLCVRASDSTMRIACVFDELPSQLVIDAQHATNLAQEYLLNSSKYLEIVKVYDLNYSKQKCSIYARAMHPSASKYDDLLSLTNSKLRERARDLGVDLGKVNQTINADLRRAIWTHAKDLQLEERDVELKSEAAKAIWDQLKKELPLFALFKADRPSTDQDAEAQDPMKAAVKEAIRAQENVLNAIADKVKSEVQEIATRTVEKIAEMNPELARRLTPRVSIKNWDTLFSVSLTGDEDIPINKRGSGTRRLILLNFFRARAEKEASERNTGVIYAIEEPETSQHPNNQLLLVKALQELSEQPRCQVFLTTHTPVLARRFSQGSLRYITMKDGGSVVCDCRDEDTVRQIVESLGVLPDHSVKVFFGVEGRNDISFLCSISKILSDAGEKVPDLGAAEKAGVLVFVPLGGSNLDLWVSKLKGFNRPEFYLFDRDNAPPKGPRYKAEADKINCRPHCRAWHTGKRELENYIHRDVIAREYPHYRGTGDDFEDVPELLAKAIHEASESKDQWGDVLKDSAKLKQKISQAKKKLCFDLVRNMTPDLLTQVDPNGDVRMWLREIGEALKSEDIRSQGASG
jgi:predicted ATPase